MGEEYDRAKDPRSRGVYSAGAVCDECGGPSPRVFVCGECETAAKYDEEHQRIMAPIVAERDALRAQLEHAEAEAHRLRERVAGLEADLATFDVASPGTIYAGGVDAGRIEERAAVVALVKLAIADNLMPRKRIGAAKALKELLADIERGDHVKREGE